MGGDGTPEESTKRLGEEISRLRNSRDLTRKKLVTSILYSIGPDHPLVDTISEGWLTRLENGRTVNVTHEELEIILTALRCTPNERAQALIRANRNPLIEPNGSITPEAELLSQIMAHLYQNAEVQDALKNLRNDRRNASSTDEKINKIVQRIAKAFETQLAVNSKQL